MIFHLEKNSGVPLFLQIKRYFEDLIDNGSLQPGSKLPSSRSLAERLRVNRNTVVTAYQEMESDGRVQSVAGRGTFVQQRPVSMVRTTLPARHSDAVPRMSFVDDENGESSRSFNNLITDYLKQEGEISFCIPHAPRDSYPVREFQNCAYHAIQKFGTEIFDLGPSYGFEPFVRYLPTLLLRRGIQTDIDQLLVTNGIQQGIDLVVRSLLKPGDCVLLENLTYPGAISIFQERKVRMVGIPVDDEGMCVGKLERLILENRPKLIYTIPTFQSPTCTVMPPERRATLTTIAAKHGVLLVEDDYLGEIRVTKYRNLYFKSIRGFAQIVALLL